jgi:tRNA-splicing ligase RtcB
MITGDTLKDWGFTPGPKFGLMLAEARLLESMGNSKEEIIDKIGLIVLPEDTRTEMRTNNIPFGQFIDANNDMERENVASVVRHMDALMRIPTIKSGVILPDACPSGSQLGTIPVGGAVACEDAIHPGFHSADICCSVAISIFKRNENPKFLLDTFQKATHFGPGGPNRIVKMPDHLSEMLANLSDNPFIKGLENMAIGHFGSQGDGNHFAYVGHLESTGNLALVTHHGSRGFGAQVFKRGLAVAKKHTKIVAARVPEQSAWIKADSDNGRAYWEALQFIREWTKANHYVLHGIAATLTGNKITNQFWNEHNFVFQRSDGLFYHGKGATPSWKGFAADDVGLTLIPLNMSQPILITEHVDKPEALGFAPHGAGRNMSRSQFIRENSEKQEELDALAAKGLDIRSYCGTPDYSELPSAYKNADEVTAQIEKYGLAKVVDRVLPYGSLMAGDIEHNAPWKKKKK